MLNRANDGREAGNQVASSWTGSRPTPLEEYVVVVVVVVVEMKYTHGKHRPATLPINDG